MSFLVAGFLIYILLYGAVKACIRKGEEDD